MVMEVYVLYVYLNIIPRKYYLTALCLKSVPALLLLNCQLAFFIFVNLPAQFSALNDEKYLHLRKIHISRFV